ncbi:diacylglycerol kinase family protein [Egicoccus sp. AB-alg6-2]|uniref:diacylglycerol/lipid kinase family protein n=1 Tax=Egicoccus sp. AB-alg6-2 TaxID=3242692 RepID=UPI00359CFF63
MNAAPNAGHVLLVNHAAGSSEDAAIAEAAAVLEEAGSAVELRTCHDPADVDGIIEALDGRTLVVCGGDGSLHVAVSRLHAADRLSCPVGLLPLGTGNDFARAVGLPLDDPAAAARHLAAASPRPMDLLAEDGGRICVNALHLGLGATAAARAESMKASLSDLAYPVGALLAGVTETGTDVRVEVDGETVSDGPALMVAICNGTGFGGGARMAPDADPADGRVDVVVVSATGPLERTAFGLALQRGTHLERDDVLLLRGRRVRVQGDALRDDVDGELGEPSDAPRTWQVEPGAWRFVG